MFHFYGLAGVGRDELRTPLRLLWIGPHASLTLILSANVPELMVSGNFRRQHRPKVSVPTRHKIHDLVATNFPHELYSRCSFQLFLRSHLRMSECIRLANKLDARDTIEREFPKTGRLRIIHNTRYRTQFCFRAVSD